MKLVVTSLVLIVVLGVTGQCLAAPVAAAVTGVVRDAHGTPQMGAMVELLSADASRVAAAFTDNHGRYIVPAVNPGRYQLRATAAFFVPVTRANLRLQAGAEAIVNVTMSTLFEAENWLPAQRRSADEPADDWKWTLRSTASRPLLRLIDPDDGTVMSSSAEHVHTASQQGRVSVLNGDGAFGEGGMHQVLVLNRTIEDGDGAVLRADVGDPQSPFPVGPSVSATAGYERRTGVPGMMGGSTRLVSSFQSHPEMTDGYAAGFQVLQLASTQQMSLGDAVMIDAGTLLEAERLQASLINAEPFIRVTTRPASDVIVEYRYATARGLQSSNDLDKLKPTVMALTDSRGKPLTSKGSHNEVSVSKKFDGGRVLSLAAFSDDFKNGALAGSGILANGVLQGSSVLADPTTGTFHLATAGYSGRGMSVAMMQPITPALSARIEMDMGTALSGNGALVSMAQLQSNVTAHTTQAASASLRGKVLKTGTALKAEYRWQPVRTLTQVNAYNSSAEEAYLSFYVRQKLWCGRFLPEGLDAVVEATNLLQQGYQPVLSPDGHTLFLAQIPRAIQGGLAFNF